MQLKQNVVLETDSFLDFVFFSRKTRFCSRMSRISWYLVGMQFECLQEFLMNIAQIVKLVIQHIQGTIFRLFFLRRIASNFTA